MAIPLRDDVPTRRFPWVTVALIIANVVVFLVLQPSAFQAAPGPDEAGSSQRIEQADRFVNTWGAIPCEVVSGQPAASQPVACKDSPEGPVPAHKVVWLALLTSLFLHGNVAHILGNLWFLWVFGNNVEDRLGRAAFVALYLVGGIVASLGFVLVNPHTAQALIGASGAIAAVMGAYLVFFPRGQVLTVIATAAFQVVYVPAAVVLVLFFVTQFLTPGDGVAWQAHVAGMVFGVLVALIASRTPWLRARREADARAALLRNGSAF